MTPTAPTGIIRHLGEAETAHHSTRWPLGRLMIHRGWCQILGGNVMGLEFLAKARLRISPGETPEEHPTQQAITV
jgi:hypothetical protein